MAVLLIARPWSGFEMKNMTNFIWPVKKFPFKIIKMYILKFVTGIVFTLYCFITRVIVSACRLHVLLRATLRYIITGKIMTTSQVYMLNRQAVEPVTWTLWWRQRRRSVANICSIRWHGKSLACSLIYSEGYQHECRLDY